MSTVVRAHDDRPTVVAAVLATAAAVLSVAAVANDPSQLLAVAIEVGAVLALGGGALLYTEAQGAENEKHGADAGRRAVAVFAVCVGVVGAAVALGLAVYAPTGMTARLELVPGLLGVTTLVCGLLPVRRGRWARYLVGTGAALLVIAALTSGVVYGADTVALLSATALAIVAWDAGEQAINLGTHVGRRGETATAALVHVGASTVVGVVAVTVALLVRSMQVTGLSLPALALLLGAAVLLAAALSE
ncbi:DUF7519 family protein [Halobellus limi]|uniref:Uncharacterized protein n=1 Tax=Halobellus limi TaxID=699433 RepID=A0A1H6C5A9_9EURY|nr:hypothetical protein [Halobellus limi]QCC48616.1 hypothetical protein DV707_13640 [Halobellus limi]SEG67825.1 hypothetical protein SAMN04488133_3217 [Halobellus limi]